MCLGGMTHCLMRLYQILVLFMQWNHRQVLGNRTSLFLSGGSGQ